MVDLNRLVKLADEWDKQTTTSEQNNRVRNQEKLVAMVNKYGVRAVALATGFAESTVKQHFYTRSSVPVISDRAIERAEHIFTLL